MNTNKLLVIITIIFGVILVFIIFMQNRRSEISMVDVKSQVELENCKADFKVLFSHWKCELNSNETLLSNAIAFENEDFNKININKLFNAQSKLVFRITDNVASCFDCKSKVFVQLKKLGELIGFDNIIIVGRFTKMRNLIILKEQEKFEFNIYNYNKNLNIYAEKNDRIDYLFVLDKNLETKLTFIATNVSIEKIEAYFSKITNYFDSNH